ncbi:MAG: ATP-binding protein [Deltaproteobacteria bacterium]|nr:ATP-binding protein [Deltaproteobacteria bacterium]
MNNEHREPFSLTEDIVRRMCRDDIVVVGPQGSGKSRLLGRLAATAISAGEQILVATTNEAAFGTVFSQSCFEEWSRCQIHYFAQERRSLAKEAARDFCSALERGGFSLLVIDDVLGSLGGSTLELVERVMLEERVKLWLSVERPSDWARLPFVSRLLETRLRLFTLGATPPLSYIVEHRRYANGSTAQDLITDFAYPRAGSLDFVLNRDCHAEIVRLPLDAPPLVVAPIPPVTPALSRALVNEAPVKPALAEQW